MPKPDIRARAAAAHIAVVGAGVAGLVAARECAKLGIRVTLLEASDRLGGMVRQAQLGERTVDTGAEIFSTKDAETLALLKELKLAGDLEEVPAAEAWLVGVPGAGRVKLPTPQLAGIPINVFDEGVRRVIGWGGLWRAYFDRLRPPLTIGHEESFGKLVATRMGAKVRDQLIAPRSLGVWGVHPDDLNTETVAPGISGSLTRVGSLTGAAATLAEKQTTTRGALVGGMPQLLEALISELPTLGVEVRTAARVSGIAQFPSPSEQSETKGWQITVDTEGAELSETLRADAVIVATDALAAADLLESLVEAPAPEPFDVESVTLLVDAPGLAGQTWTEAFAHPASGAKFASITRPIATRDAPQHLLRVTFGTHDQPPATADLSDEAAIALSASQAQEYLSLADFEVVAGHRERFNQSLPAAHSAAAAQRADAREAVLGIPGLGATGAWIAGSGLSRVIGDATAEAERVRSAVLWESTEA